MAAGTAIAHAGNAQPHRADEDEEARMMEATQMLWDASAAGDSKLQLLSQALAAGARVDWRDAEDRGNCALHKAAEVGAVGLVKLLLKAEGCWGRGAAPSSRNAFNDSPLHAAAYKGHAAVATLLIEAQVCADCVQWGGMTTRVVEKGAGQS
jgi:ankyrin repeat protein